MKKKSILYFLVLMTMTGCQRNSTETWEDVKTAGRYLQKSIYALWGSDDESRQIASQDEFLGPSEDEFIPLQENDLLKGESSSLAYRKEPSKNSFKEPARSFLSPSNKMNQIFRVIHFGTDNHVIKEHEDLVTVARIASYLKKNPKARVLVEGHCDKRASADYNMTLGMRRAHHIEVLLKKQGVSSSQIQTVSWGKEKLLSQGDSNMDHKMNRRAEFKLQK